MKEKAITGACGFMALFQREVAQALRVPVFLSSLMQLPFIHRTLREEQCIGVITAGCRKSLTDEHFSAPAGVAPSVPIVIAGMENQPEFSEAVMHEKEHRLTRTDRAGGRQCGQSTVH